MNFLQRTPFFRLLLPVMAGILLFQIYKLPLWVLGLMIITSFLFIICSLFIKNSSFQYKFRWLFGCGVFLLLITLSYFLTLRTEYKSEFQDLNKQGTFLVELIGIPVEKPRSYLCEVKVLGFSDSASLNSSYGKAYLYLQKDSIVPYLLHGDRLVVDTEFNAPQSMRNPDGFDYSTYLKRQGIAATAYASSGNWVNAGRNERVSLLHLANKCRNYLLNIYREYGITGREFAVLSALTLGYKDEIDTDLKNSYSVSGAMHILAVSGLHVGIVYAVLAFLFSFLNKSVSQRIIKTIIILLLLWCYAFITGLSPSVFRAALMFTFAAIGSVFSRKSLTYNTIFMSAFLMLLINPNLLFSVSFQLSYSAVISIIYFQPKISSLLTIKNKFLRWTWELLAVSLAAQIGTLPFVLFYFQSFPNYFLLTNMIVIPAATLIIYMAFALLLFSFLPLLPNIIAYLLTCGLTLLNFSVDFINKLPYSTSVLGINYIQIILIFIIIFFSSHYFHSRKYVSLAGTLCAVILFLGINAYTKYSTLQSRKLIVYESYRDTHVNLLNGCSNYIYTTNEEDVFRTASAFWNNKKIDLPMYIENLSSYNDGFFISGGKRILILQEDYGMKYKSAEPIQIDYLIIGNKLKPRINLLLECVKPKMIIIDKTISPWYTEEIERFCQDKNIPFHSVRRDGAFVTEI